MGRGFFFLFIVPQTKGIWRVEETEVRAFKTPLAACHESWSALGSVVMSESSSLGRGAVAHTRAAEGEPLSLP